MHLFGLLQKNCRIFRLRKHEGFVLRTLGGFDFPFLFYKRTSDISASYEKRIQLLVIGSTIRISVRLQHGQNVIIVHFR